LALSHNVQDTVLRAFEYCPATQAPHTRSVMLLDATITY
jgi:hypothetical protein